MNLDGNSRNNKSLLKIGGLDPVRTSSARFHSLGVQLRLMGVQSGGEQGAEVRHKETWFLMSKPPNPISGQWWKTRMLVYPPGQ